MPPAKILLCHNYYQQAGGEDSVFANELDGLRSRGHPVVVYTRHNSEIESMGLLGRAALVPSAFSSLRTRQEIDRLVRQERPDVAIVQNVFPLISPAVYTALHALGVPVIQAVYNYRLVCPAGELYSRGAVCERCLGGNYLQCVVRTCYRNSVALSAWYAGILGFHRLRGSFRRCVDRFMVPDDFLGRKLAEGGIPASRIRRNVNPFFAADFAPTNRHQGYVLFVGRLVPQKGVRTLLRAIPLAESRPELRIVGHGELEQEIRARIACAPGRQRVSLLGPRWGTELKQLMAGAAAVIIPSEWYDNLPLVLCQANASGKPVIASRIDGLPEYVREGTNGFLFEPGDAGALARLIDRVMGMDADGYARLCETARRLAVAELDYDSHYRVLLDTIGELVAAGRARPDA